MNIKERTITKIKAQPKIFREVIEYGGCIMFDSIGGGIYHCCDDDKTYYQRWDDELEKFVIFEWRMGGLNGLNLNILDKNEIN